MSELQIIIPPVARPDDVIPPVGIPHVVILGAGFAGLSAGRALAKAPCRVTVVDRCNYHLFQPWLYQAATAVLSPADTAVPIRSILRRQCNARVLMGGPMASTARQPADHVAWAIN